MASECCLISHLDARRFWCIFVLAILETNAELGVPAIPSAEDEANTTYAHRTKAMAKHRGRQHLRSKWESKALHDKCPQLVKQADMNQDKTHRSLKAAGLKAEIEGFIIAAQDQSLPTQWLYCHNLYQSSHFVIPVAICNKSITLFNFL